MGTHSKKQDRYHVFRCECPFVGRSHFSKRRKNVQASPAGHAYRFFFAIRSKGMLAKATPFQSCMYCFGIRTQNRAVNSTKDILRRVCLSCHRIPERIQPTKDTTVSFHPPLHEEAATAICRSRLFLIERLTLLLFSNKILYPPFADRKMERREENEP